MLDVPLLEQQLLGLVWRGGKIDHPNGEHDDWANAACGALLAARELATTPVAREPSVEEVAAELDGPNFLDAMDAELEGAERIRRFLHSW